MQHSSAIFPHDFSYVISPGAGSPGESGAPACANPGCALPEQAGRGATFGGQQLCSSECVEAMLRSTLVEEHALSTAAALENGSRVRIGQILVDQGVITEAQLERALRSQKLTGAGRLGTWLRQQTQLPEEEFAAALSIQWRCPIFRIGAFVPERMAGYLPRPLVEALDALPLRVSRTPERLTICFEDRVDAELLRALERMHGIPVEAGLLSSSEFWHGCAELNKAVSPPFCVVEAGGLDEMVGAMSVTMTRTNGSDAQLVFVRNHYWLRIWLAGEGDNTQALDVLCTLRRSSEAAPEGQLVDEIGAGLAQRRTPAS